MGESLSKAPKANSRVENLHEAILEKKNKKKGKKRDPWVKTSWRRPRQVCGLKTSVVGTHLP